MALPLDCGSSLKEATCGLPHTLESENERVGRPRGNEVERNEEKENEKK